MATNSPRELALSLVSAARDHPDLTVKLSSLRQVKDMLFSTEQPPPPSLVAELVPYLVELQFSNERLVRKLLVEICEEIGLKLLDYSPILMPVLSLLTKDDDPGVARQSILTSMKFFSTIVEEMAFQFHQHGKIERWAGEAWTWIVKYKDAMYSTLLEPLSMGTRLLALKFLEMYVLVFTPETSDSDTEGKDHAFNISWVSTSHPVLDPVAVTAESNKFLFSLVDLLGPKNSLPGLLTIAVVNCLAAIARKRPNHYPTVLSALMDFNTNFESFRGAHAASIHYSLRTAFLGFLRCIHPAFIESREKLLRALREMNAGDAADQVLRLVDKMMKNNGRALRDARLNKDDLSSNSQGVSVDVSKRKQSILENEEDLNGPELGPKRMRYSSVNQFPPPSLMQDSDHSSANGASTNAPFLNDSLTPAEKMIAMIGAFLCEGERGAESLELLISQMHPDLLADIVITNMKHLPKAPPSSKLENLPRVAQNGWIDARQVAPAASTPAHGLVPATPDAFVSAIPASASPTDLSVSTNHSGDPRRGPRRDPRRLDPRRMIAPVEVSSPQPTEQTTCTQFVIDAPASDKPPPRAVANTEDNSRSSVSKLEFDGNITENSSIAETDQVMGEAVVPDEAKETPCSPDSGMTIENKPSFVLVDNDPISQNMTVIDTSDQEDVPSLLDSDEQSQTVSDTPAAEETHKDLPEVPPYVELSDDQHNAMRNFAIEQFVQSYKYLERVDHSQTILVLVSRLVSQMGTEQTESLVKEEIISNYKHKQGHELVILVLYHLYSLVKSESSDQSLLADAYDKFFVDVAKALLGKFPTTDKSFSRLLSEAPILPNSILEVLDNLCSSDGYEQLREDDRDSDHVSQGLGTVWALILGRPVNREACLNIALKCTVHQNEVIRKKAIRLVANKLYPLDYISKKVEQYATRVLLSVAGTDSPLVQSSDSKTEAVSEEASFSSQLSQHGGPTTNKMKAADPLSLSGSSVSSPEAKRLMSLYFALCTKRPSLLRLVFNVYGQAPKIVKQTMQEFLHLMPILTGASGPPSPELLHIISDPPSGSEDLLRLVLELLMKSPPSPNLVATVIHLYETKLKDATILIPMLSSLSKHEVLPIFPRLVDLPLDKFQKALDPILQGSAHSGPALTPAEALVALHDIVPEKEGIALKKVMDACSACFEQRMVFTEKVLAKALSQMVERNPLPLLLMRTVIQAIDAYPTLVDFVMEILSKLVVKQLWKMPKLWVGFMKCVSQTQPHSFRVLLQLPPPQLENALNKYPNLRGSLAAYASQPKVRASLSRSILSVLGLSVEHLQQLRAPSHLNAPDTSSSVQGATLT
ncbi:hypothetical protein Droror1_Dr00010154 [Drosera rotundifolia]